MPQPIRLAKTRFYEGHVQRLDPPSASARPSAAPNTIWHASIYKSRIASYELVLAFYSAATPSTGGVPEFQHVLAWIVIVHRWPGVSSGAARPLPGATTVPRPPCVFVTVVDVFDARSGKELVSTEGA